MIVGAVPKNGRWRASWQKHHTPHVPAMAGKKYKAQFIWNAKRDLIE